MSTNVNSLTPGKQNDSPSPDLFFELLAITRAGFVVSFQQATYGMKIEINPATAPQTIMLMPQHHQTKTIIPTPYTEIENLYRRIPPTSLRLNPRHANPHHIALLLKKFRSRFIQNAV